MIIGWMLVCVNYAKRPYGFDDFVNRVSMNFWNNI